MNNNGRVFLISPITDDVYERLEPICNYLQNCYKKVVVGLFDFYKKQYSTDNIEYKFRQRGYEIIVFSFKKAIIYRIYGKLTASLHIVTFRHTQIHFKLLLMLFFYFFLPYPKLLIRSNLLVLQKALTEKTIRREEFFASVYCIFKNAFLFAIFYCLSYLMYLFFFPFLLLTHIKKPSMFPSNPQKILFVRMDHLGDVICTLPSCKSLKESFPSTHITFLCGPWSKDVLEAVPHLYDELLVWDAPWHNKSIRYRLNFQSLLKFLIFCWKIRKKNFDIVIQPRGEEMNVLLAALSGGKYIVSGIDVKRPLARWVGKFIEQPIKYSPYHTYHIAEWPIQCLKSLGIPYLKILESVRKVNYPIRLLQNVAEEIIQWRKKNFLICSLVISAGNKVREWPISRFASIIEYLYRHKIVTVLIGSRTDICKGRFLLELLDKIPIINLVGKTTFKDLGYVLKNSDFVLTLDTSIMHLASLLDINIVAIFSSGNIRLAKPFFSENYQVIKKELGCSGCSDICFLTEPLCILAIEIEDVKKALEPIIFQLKTPLIHEQ